MGRRAQLMAKFSRKAENIVRNTKRQNCLILMTNHVQSMIMGFGVTTPGGDAKNFLSSVRIHVTKRDDVTEAGYQLIGKVAKNRYGYNGRQFSVYNLAGWGFHPGLTAVYDCINLKLATKERTIKMGGKTYGFASQLPQHIDDDEFFQPFFDTLRRNKAVFAAKPEIIIEKEEDDE